MHACTVTNQVTIEQGTLADYEALSRFHYRPGRLGPFETIYALRPARGTRTAAYCESNTLGVIVYALPAAGNTLRRQALADLLAGLDRRTQLSLLNQNVRTIARVIIEPRLRGLGLAVRLVRDTMGLLDVPVIEALAVMGRFNPFFEKAGMTAYRRPSAPHVVSMTVALSILGIEPDEFIDPAGVHEKLERLGRPDRDFIEPQLRLFLKHYGRRRSMPPSLERTRFVLGRLTEPAVYYLWRNPNAGLKLA